LGAEYYRQQGFNMCQTLSGKKQITQAGDKQQQLSLKLKTGFSQTHKKHN